VKPHWKWKSGWGNKTNKADRIKTMFFKESEWVRKALIEIGIQNQSILDIGAASEDYRRTKQKYIGELYDFVAQQGGKIVTLDIDKESKPDILADITNDKLLIEIENRFDVVIACNLLEHVENIDNAIKNILGMVKNGGFLIVTVPQKLDIHLSPIDNGLRVTAAELVGMFIENAKCIKAESWVDEHYREPFISDPNFPKPEVSGVVLEKV
jgi:2-polyprenyl-3-methyl-5-hydroxy-6-metoxy-1,4-benzoquinol methylase